MRITFHLRFPAIYFLLVLIIGCEQRSTEELSSKTPLANGKEEVASRHKQVLAIPELAIEDSKKDKEKDGIYDQQEQPNNIHQPKKFQEAPPQPKFEGDINSFPKPYKHQPIEKPIKADNNNQAPSPVHPFAINLGKEEVPLQGRESTIDQKENTRKPEEPSIIVAGKKEKVTIDQKESTRKSEEPSMIVFGEKEKEPEDKKKQSVKELPPPQIKSPCKVATTKKIIEKKGDTAQPIHVPGKKEDEEQPQPWPPNSSIPNPPPVEATKDKTDFPTIGKLNKELGINVLDIKEEDTLQHKDIPTLIGEFNKIQQAYDSVNQASTLNELTEEAKLRLNQELFLINKPRRIYYNALKTQLETQKEDQLEKVKKEIVVKQAQLTKIKQDIERGTSTALEEELSSKISKVQKELEELQNQIPKISQYKNRVQEFNQAKQEAECKIEEKEKELSNLKKQQNSIAQRLATQQAESECLEKEIVQLQKEVTKTIEACFKKQFQEVEDIFNKKASSAKLKKDIKGCMVENMSRSMDKIPLIKKELPKKDDPNSFEQDWEDD